MEPLLSPCEGRILRKAGEDMATSLWALPFDCSVLKPSTGNEGRKVVDIVGLREFATKNIRLCVSDAGCRVEERPF